MEQKGEKIININIGKRQNEFFIPSFNRPTSTSHHRHYASPSAGAQGGVNVQITGSQPQAKSQSRILRNEESRKSLLCRHQVTLAEPGLSGVGDSTSPPSPFVHSLPHPPLSTLLFAAVSAKIAFVFSKFSAQHNNVPEIKSTTLDFLKHQPVSVICLLQ